MATETSRRSRVLTAALALAGAAVVAATALLASTLVGDSSASTQVGGASAFRWLVPGPAPASWHACALRDRTARLSYPADWRSIKTDPGTFSAALRAPDGRIRGYLNATPQQGEETLADWGAFRVDHNGDEGDTDIRLIASAANLRFRDGQGSCVIDGYTTSSGHRYREIACIVAGAGGTSVVVGAAPPGGWSSAAPALERSISAFET